MQPELSLSVLLLPVVTPLSDVVVAIGKFAVLKAVLRVSHKARLFQ
jgi:hypothetical protein